MLWPIAVLISSCGPIGYSVSAVVGEILLLSSAVPIDEALHDPRLSDEQKEKLTFLIRARDYAEQVVGLNVFNSYQTFANLGDKPLAWNLSASRKDILEPYFWDVPIMGPLPFFGFFDFDQAITERDRLVGLNYDTLIYEVDAYSTVGILPDPVTSALLDGDLVSLFDTLFHELLHNTIFKQGDTTFNESLANYVGRTAAVEFIKVEFGEDSPLVKEANRTFADMDRFNEFIQELIEEVNVVYNSDMSYDDKLMAREDIFEAARNRFAEQVLPLMNNPVEYERYTTLKYNNAFLLINMRYNSDQEVYAGIFEMVGGDWSQALTIFSQAAAKENPVEYLRGILGQ
jgi:predicted aminopeptidase